MAVAVITGASRGFGLALAETLGTHGWSLVLDARGAAALDGAAASVRAAAPGATVRAVAGDVSDPEHRAALVETASELGGLDLLVNNASLLGPSPQPVLADYPLETLRRVYDVNVLGPLGLIQAALPLLRASGRGAIVDVTSDAAVEGYEGWGGYGSSKAALDQLGNVLGAEEPDLRVYSFDPGDMRTQMHQEAFPGDDISDRPEPATVVPALLSLLDERPESGRYRASERVEAKP
ncbi:MAG: short-chain dehydrogenase/reductase [Actinomycetia bacterium]|nr:short-chain dehydrogenase/reductase [Actinomycetes bacterium]